MEKIKAGPSKYDGAWLFVVFGGAIALGFLLAFLIPWRHVPSTTRLDVSAL